MISTEVSCPGWCTLPAGHPFDDVDGGFLLREHERLWTLQVPQVDGVEVPPVEVALVAEEEATNPNGPTVLSRPLVCMTVSEEVLFSPAQARALAAALLEAATTAEAVAA